MSRIKCSAILFGVMLMGGAAPSIGQTTFACTATTTSAIADKIANGHAWTEHSSEFVAGKLIAGLGMPATPKVTTIAEFKVHIVAAMGSATNKALLRDRKAYWYATTGTIVFHDKNSADCGTAFRPSTGKPYYDTAS
jgi:hypothetical protein